MSFTRLGTPLLWIQVGHQQETQNPIVALFWGGPNPKKGKLTGNSKCFPLLGGGGPNPQAKTPRIPPTPSARFGLDPTRHDPLRFASPSRPALASRSTEDRREARWEAWSSERKVRSKRIDPVPKARERTRARGTQKI